MPRVLGHQLPFRGMPMMRALDFCANSPPLRLAAIFAILASVAPLGCSQPLRLTLRVDGYSAVARVTNVGATRQVVRLLSRRPMRGIDLLVDGEAVSFREHTSCTL